MANEYRCTRSKLYGPESLGFNDVTAREGHYIIARTEDGARQEMIRRFVGPDAEMYGWGKVRFTVDLWKENMPAWLIPVEDQESN